MTVLDTSLQIPVTGRSVEVWRHLDLALAARRAVAMTGHVSDVLVAANGALIRLPEFLAFWAAANDSQLVVLDTRTGARPLLPPGASTTGTEISAPPGPMVQLLDRVNEQLDAHPSAATLFVDFACLELANDDGELLRRILELPHDTGLAAGGHQLILAFRTEEPPRQISATPGWTVLQVPLPDAAERGYVLTRAAERAPVPLEPDLNLSQLGALLGGVDSDGLLRLCSEARNGPRLSSARVVEVKAAEISRMAGGTLIVDRAPPPNGIAGMAGLRLYIEDSLAAGTPLEAILLAGVPGVGKTHSFRWLAHRLGLPAVMFGQLRGGIVGESERLWEQARRTLVANAPAVVFIDECDQIGLGTRTKNLDSGVSDRLRAGIFEVINDAERSGVTFVLATNNPAGIDVAGLDRLTVIPVLHPSLHESVEIMVLAADRLGWQLDADGTLAVLEESHELLTGRQLVRMLKRAARHAARAGHRGNVTRADLALAADDSIEVVDRLSHEFMALSALKLADSRETFPWVSAQQLGEPSEIPPYVLPLMDVGGNLDMSKVHARITELRRGGHGFDA